MSINIVATVGENREIGKDNRFIWYFNDVFKDIERLTRYHDVLFSESGLELYGKYYPEILQQRRLFVLGDNDFDKHYNVNAYKDPDMLLKKYGETGQKLFILGGYSVFEDFICFADKIYLNEIEDTDFLADTYLTYFEEEKYVKKLIKQTTNCGINCNHSVYERK